MCNSQQVPSKETRCRTCHSLGNLLRSKVRPAGKPLLQAICRKFGDPEDLVAQLRDGNARCIAQVQHFMTEHEHGCKAQAAADSAGLPAAAQQRSPADAAGDEASGAAVNGASKAAAAAAPEAHAPESAPTAQAAKAADSDEPPARTRKTTKRKRCRSPADVRAPQRHTRRHGSAEAQVARAAGRKRVRTPRGAAAGALGVGGAHASPPAAATAELQPDCMSHDRCSEGTDVLRATHRPLLSLHRGEKTRPPVCHVCQYLQPADDLSPVPDCAHAALMQLNPGSAKPKSPEGLLRCINCAKLMDNGLKRGVELGATAEQVVRWVKNWMLLRRPAPWLLHPEVDHWRFVRWAEMWEWAGMSDAARAAAQQQRAAARKWASSHEGWLGVTPEDREITDPHEWWVAADMQIGQKVQQAGMLPKALPHTSGASK